MINQDQHLALAYSPAPLRTALSALLAFDGLLGHAFRVTRETPLLHIRLAWWREQLAASAVRDPALAAVNGLISKHPAMLQALERVVEGWMVLIDDPPYDEVQLLTFAHGRGSGLFAAAALLADCPVNDFAGQGWALADLARHCSHGPSAELADKLARQLLDGTGKRLFPVKLRSLALMVHFARKDSHKSAENKCRIGSPIRIVHSIGFLLGK